MRTVLALLTMATSLASGACTPRLGASKDAARSTDAIGIEEALRGFVTAIEQLDFEALRARFADDACVFFPSASTPERFCGRDAFEQRFRRTFDAIRSETPSGAPYPRLVPENLRIEGLGDGAAVASFELRSSARVGRRTVVFRRVDGRWLIVHLHASNVPWPDAPGR